MSADAGDLDAGDLEGGNFGSWLEGMQRALRGEGESDVPCGSCTACCTASQFVHIAPDEVVTRSHIPSELLFPAPQRPAGHLVMGYDERGCCPMLVDGACSIYEHRPRTCRTYDCRVFPAAGLFPTESTKTLIAQRARRWRFAFPTAEDDASWAAVRAAGAYVRARGEGSATQQAVMAVEVHDVFRDTDADPAEVDAAVRRLRVGSDPA